MANVVFVGPSTVAVDGRRVEVNRAVIATGARAAEPPSSGLQEGGYYTNETIFTLTELPRRLLVVGAGPIGCELAQSFQRFGSQVTMITDGMEILPKEDPDAAAVLRRQLDREGVRVITAGLNQQGSRWGLGKRLGVENGGKSHEVEVGAMLAAVWRSI